MMLGTTLVQMVHDLGGLLGEWHPMLVACLSFMGCTLRG